MIEASRVSINNVFPNPNWEDDELYWDYDKAYGVNGTREFFQYGICDDNDLQKVPYTDFESIVINAESIFNSIVSNLHAKKNESLLKVKLIKIIHHLEEQHVIDSSKSTQDITALVFTEYKRLIFNKVIKELNHDKANYNEFTNFKVRLKMTFDQRFARNSKSIFMGKVVKEVLSEKKHSQLVNNKLTEKA